MKKITLIALSMFLVACSSPSVDDLVNDPKLLSKIMDKCESLREQGKNIDTAECNNAISATKQIILNGTEDSIKLIKKNSKLIVDDLQRKAPKEVEEFEKSAQKALGNAKENADELFEKARKLLEE